MTRRINLRTAFKVSRNTSSLYTLATVALVVAVFFAANVCAQDQPTSASSGFKWSEQDSVHTSTVHHYQSAAVEANDALLITEVKAALADDGVTAYRAVVVDCDHGTITLNGVVGSFADAQRAARVARNANGVVAVKNELKWP
jgi:osmotically-inducible protein OsmY